MMNEENMTNTIKLDWTQAAYEAGYQAFIDHEPITANPFDMPDFGMPDLAEAWDGGWRAMEKDYTAYLAKPRIGVKAVRI